jgi:APA family basic amino acid/polyamine antiporter
MSAEPDSHPRDRLRRQLSASDATLLVVASVIGSGIFFTPGRVADLLGDPAWILAAWVLGALLSLAGALANAELGSMFPRAGGDYVYLREAFHPAAGFLVGWLSFFAIYTGTIVALAAAFATGVATQLGWGQTGTLAIAIGVTIGISALNYVGVRWGALANNLTSLLKVGALMAFVVVGPLTGAGDFSRLWQVGEADIGSKASAFGSAMSPVLFSYLGWNASVYVASEIRDPGRNLPRSLFAGLAICAVVYLLVNAVYLYSLPMESLRGALDAGQASALALFGPAGGALVAVFVLVSILGTLNATVLVGPRIAYAMALDHLFFPGVDRVSQSFGTPGLAIIVQGAVSVVLLLFFPTFASAVDFTIFAILLATMGDVAALYRLRRTQPDRPRPYRAWGYPVVPGLYLAATGSIAVSLMLASPFEAAVGLAMLAAGLPFYLWFVRRPAPA